MLKLFNIILCCIISIIVDGSILCVACCADGLIKLFTLNVEPSSEQTCCISSTLSTSFHPTGGTGGLRRRKREREREREEGREEGEAQDVWGGRKRRLLLLLFLFRFND